MGPGLDRSGNACLSGSGGEHDKQRICQAGSVARRLVRSFDGRSQYRREDQSKGNLRVTVVVGVNAVAEVLSNGVSWISLQ